MAALPPIRKFYIEDFASQKSWIGPFLIILNSFMSAVIDALTKGLTLADNSTSDIRYVTLTSVPTLTAPTSILWSKPMAPIAIMVGNIRLNTGDFTLADAVQVQYKMSPSNTAIQITNVVGITPTSTAQYTLTLICIAG